MLTDSKIQLALRQHYLFERLPEPLFQDLCKLAIHRKLESGSVLFHQGEPADRFYLLLDGQVTLTRVLPEGQEKLVRVVTSGQTFAEALLFTGQRFYPVTASAFKASSLVSIDGVHFRQVLEEQPRTCLEMLGSLSTRLQQRLHEIDTLTLANASRRVARFLCQELKPGSDQVQLKVPKRLIASQLGIQPETFSRILHRLIDAGLIAMERRVIRVLDQDGLINYQE